MGLHPHSGLHPDFGTTAFKLMPSGTYSPRPRRYARDLMPFESPARDSEHYCPAKRAKRLRVADSPAQLDVSCIVGSVADSDPISGSGCKLNPAIDRHGQNTVASQSQSVPRSVVPRRWAFRCKYCDILLLHREAVNLSHEAPWSTLIHVPITYQKQIRWDAAGIH